MISQKNYLGNFQNSRWLKGTASNFARQILSFPRKRKKKSPKHTNGNRWISGTMWFSFCALKPEAATLMKFIKIQTEDSIV